MGAMKQSNELVFGLVGPTGTNLQLVENTLKDLLGEYDFKANTVKLSDLIREPLFKDIGPALPSEENQYELTIALMDKGSAIRRKAELGSFLTMYGTSKICEARQKPADFSRFAHIFNSLKHPDESIFLRNCYGFAYFQIGVCSEEEDRLRYLQAKKGVSTKSAALKLIEKDEAENDPYGQQTRDTFHLSDVFVFLDSNQPEVLKTQLQRLLDLIFSHPHITPTAEEHLMFMAFAYAARSGDLSRQVGAVLANQQHDVLGVGSNDVPKAEGGPYWPGEGIIDQRDHVRGFDSNVLKRNQLILEVMKKTGSTGSDESILKKGLEHLGETGLMDITEYSRATHAEMEAILSSARNGVPTKGAILYCTTFPCHNCAKHIVTSGLSQVVYVEPYPKSHAKELHDDAICIGKPDGGKVCFRPFIGVAARRYLDLFSMKLGWGQKVVRKNKMDGSVVKFDRRNSKLRVPVTSTFHEDNEKLAASEIAKFAEKTRGK